MYITTQMAPPESYTELKYDNLKEDVRWTQLEVFEMAV